MIGGARQDIACQQVLLEDASVFSIQWTLLPLDLCEGITPKFLTTRYFDHIRRFTLGVVRPHRGEGWVEFRLFNTRLSLLSFTGPVFAQEGGRAAATLYICGGALVQSQSCDRGELTFSCEILSEGVKVTLALNDYCPLLLGGERPKRWRKWLYRFTQAALHKLVTVRFLMRLYRELAPRPVCCRVVKVKEAPGEEI